MMFAIRFKEGTVAVEGGSVGIDKVALTVGSLYKEEATNYSIELGMNILRITGVMSSHYSIHLQHNLDIPVILFIGGIIT
jgi:hypothetical protein